jgi:nucleoside phosphorylase/energy-coupling factor transporter ATP-binding protein EcfA2
MKEAAQRVDVGILTFREDELAAVLERFPQERFIDGQRRYSLSQVSLPGGESYRVAVTQIVPTTGSGDAADAVRNLVEDLKPSLVLLIGVAATLPSDEITLGDVVIATRVANGNFPDVILGHALKSQPMHKDVVKWASNLSAAFTASRWHGGAVVEPAPGLPPKIEVGYGQRREVLASLRQHFSGSFVDSLMSEPASHNKLRPPRPAAGTAVVIDRVLDDTYAGKLLDALANTVLAVETKSWEAYGAARALMVPMMSIRGIGEVAGLERDPKWVQYACKVAASFTLDFLKSRPVMPHQLTQHDKSTSEAPPDRPIDLVNIFNISHVVLSNVRGFREIDLSLNKPGRQGVGQWTMLLGDNGVGKTTLLRALALALAPADVAPSVLNRTGPVSPTVRASADTAIIRVGIPDEDQVTTLYIEPTKVGEKLARRVYADVAMPFLVAYGSRRGSGLVGSARGAELTSTAAVETLFDEGANLIQPDVWLMGWQLAALQSPDSQDARFFHAILATLCKLLPEVKQIHVSREGVEVEGPSLGRVPIGALSDGYRTTMGWILDMVSRWVEEAKRRDVPVDENFHEVMTGVAIIDEIDLHLHPRWQRDVVSVVRGHFPRMSFVVTTHNPLTLLGARPGEIHVLRRTDQGDVEVVQRDLPPGAGAEQTLTGDWFGLASTLDDATLDLLAEHQRLILEKGLDAPEAVAKEEELRRRLGSYADTSIERLACEAAAKVLGDDIRSLTPDARREAQGKIVALLAEPMHEGAASSPKPRAPSEPSSAKPRPRPAKRKPGAAKPKARRAGRTSS